MAALGGDGRQEVPADPGAGAVCSRTRRRKVGAAFEDRWGRRKVEAGMILGHWKTEGTEPCRACEEGGE